MNGLLTFGISSLLEMIKKPNQTEQKTVQSVLKENVVKKDNIMNGEEILPSRDKKDPIVKMVERLGEISLSDIAEKMEKSPPYVSTYVSDLERRGLIKKNRRGRRVFLSLP
jgi:DNA-binding transcriptional ArsR family regulator